MATTETVDFGTRELTDEEVAFAEELREDRLEEINAEPGSREALEAQYGQVWDTSEMTQEFEVSGFLAPFVVARRREDGVLGSLEFQHYPRFYFNWQPDEK